MFSHTGHSFEGIKNTEDPKNGTQNVVTSFYNISLQFTLISQTLNEMILIQSAVCLKKYIQDYS